MEARSETHKTAQGFAEVGTVTFQGREFANLGAVQTGDRLFAYVRREGASRCCRITTWEGKTLGHGRLGLAFEVPTFGQASTRRYVWATIDGAEWFGVYFESSGDYCLLRRREGKKGAFYGGPYTW